MSLGWKEAAGPRVFGPGQGFEMYCKTQVLKLESESESPGLVQRLLTLVPSKHSWGRSAFLSLGSNLLKSWKGHDPCTNFLHLQHSRAYWPLPHFSPDKFLFALILNISNSELMPGPSTGCSLHVLRIKAGFEQVEDFSGYWTNCIYIVR